MILITVDDVANPAVGSYLGELWQKLADPIGMLGILGQLIFTGRMIVQWYVSEKLKRSVVPKVFWHMSLWGAAMVLIYGIVRREPIVIIGQAAGFVVYVRNLVLLSHRGHSASPSSN